jgi:dihydrofolate synthase / folylpolyglutamate synthase
VGEHAIFAAMTYQQTLDYLYAHLPMYQRIGPAAYKKDLHNTLALCTHLGNPQQRFASIHVGGTNGKGSVSHLLAAALQASGLKTGLYISPHYKDFRERIKINGQYIPRKKVVDFIAQHRPVIESIQPSFFELCVAMAFDHFAREKVDIAVIEVGLGGRLDSTNVITPLLSVITNISYDHMNLLGNTLPEIAGEKAGIIKPGIPVVIGETHPESAPVFLKKATETGSKILFADQHYRVTPLKEADTPDAISRYTVHRNDHLVYPDLGVDTAGPYQEKNIATTLQAWEQFQNICTTQHLYPSAAWNLEAGFARLRTMTRFQGRWQIIGQSPMILCDSAHNEAGLRSTFGRVAQMRFRQLHIVTGMVNDKDVPKALGNFPTEARYYFAKANIPRGLPADQLKALAAPFGLRGRAYSSVKNALKAAKKNAAPNDLILVTGSVFVVAETI